MKCHYLLLALLLTLGTSGCSWFGKHESANVPKHPAPAPIVTPDTALEAGVISVNQAGRFVVLNFPTGLLPKPDQTFFLYRSGLKVGEVKITGPQQDNDIVADIVTGEAQVGDSVREQ